MRKIELELEHKFKNRFVGRRRFRPTDKLATLGSSRDASVRLLGKDIEGIHAALEYGEQGWTISDLGSEGGTWVKKKPILAQEVSAVTVVRIGGHHLKLIPKELDHQLFESRKSSSEKSINGAVKHQVIIKHSGLVVNSFLLGANESFSYLHGSETHSLTAPKSSSWVESKFSEVVVLQRLVADTAMASSLSDKVDGIWDKDLKIPMLVALLFLILISSLILMAPERPDTSLAEIKPLKNNKYTKIIYDSKTVKKKRAQAKKWKSKIASKTKAKPRKNRKTAQSKSAQKTARVMNKIRASGISQLIGKISKRAAKTATFVQAVGVSPDRKNTGAALSTIGNGKLGKAGSKKNFKVSGISTLGKAGGSSKYKGVGGLSVGSIGSASVGILEEETEIQGGLDRDVISRIIKSQIGQIRYCYERQLSANPDIYGKVLVKFTIGQAGLVNTQAIGLSTLKNAMVEGCMLRRISGWKFPKPKGGTSVRVTYPFLFRSTN